MVLLDQVIENFHDRGLVSIGREPSAFSSCTAR
jgi:hypothetical protein